MDFYENRYYWLTRKLLLLTGGWPYQDPKLKFRRNILVYSILMTLPVVQIMKLITAERNVDLWADIFTNEMILAMCLVKYLNSKLNNDKLIWLLDKLKDDWMSLENDGEQRIIRQSAEDTRKFCLCFILYVYSNALLIVFAVLLPNILDIVMPMNESHFKFIPFQAEYLVDHQKYFYPIMMHLAVVFIVLLTTIAGCDSVFMVTLFHASAMFKLASYRLEHAFDICHIEGNNNSVLTGQVCKRIGAAVECHKSAVRYCDKFISAFEVSHFIAVTLVIVNITVALYGASSFFEKGREVLSPLLLSVNQMMHFFLATCPAQQVMDYSAAVPFNAYSGQWYAAPSKTQTLILLVMKRGMKPCTVILGKVYTISMENYATVMQSSISYFMALLSLKSA